MFSSTDPAYLFDRSLLEHLEASLPLPWPPSKLDPSAMFPFPPPPFDHDSTSEHRALTGHLLSGIPTPTPAPALLPTHSSADKNMAAVAAPRDLYGICKKTLGKSEGMVASAGRRRKRRKDRHSKINTAQGLRDRRMRLSLDVARRFFDLQDMLGFDKASGTVEWLLSKSRSAIKDLTGCSSPTPVHSTDAADQAKGESTSSSECEVISASTNDKPTAGETRDAAAQEVNTLPRVKRAAARPPRKPAANPALARETRLMARARARDRTWEKKMWCRALHAVSPAVQPLSWNPLQIAGAKPGVHGVKSSPQTAAEAEQVNSYLPGRYRTSVQDQNPEAYPPPVCTGGSDQISISDYADNIAHDGAATAGFAQEQWNVQLSGNFEDPRVLLLGDDQHQARHWGPFNSPSI